MKKSFFAKCTLLMTTATAAVFVACSSATQPMDDDRMEVVSSIDDLGKCTEVNQNQKVFVDDKNAVFQCKDYAWTNVSDKKDTVTIVVSDTVSYCKQQGFKKGENECIDLGLLSVCGDSKDGEIEKNTNGKSYVCRNGSWTLARAIDMEMDKPCSKKQDGEKTRHGYSNWVCNADSVGWVYDFDNIVRDSVKYGGQTYKTVGIGNQLWMAENLNYNDSEKKPNLKDGTQCLGGKEENCDTYGRLYNWAATMNLPQEYNEELAGDKIKEKHQGICPDGWHIPSIDDWEELKTFVGENNDGEGTGVSLKSTEMWQTSKYPGTDRFGFNILPAGAVDSDKKSESQGIFAIFQSSAEEKCSKSRSDTSPCEDDISPIRADLRYDVGELRYLQSERYSRKYYMSVRCLKD